MRNEKTYYCIYKQKKGEFEENVTPQIVGDGIGLAYKDVWGFEFIDDAILALELWMYKETLKEVLPISDDYNPLDYLREMMAEVHSISKTWEASNSSEEVTYRIIEKKKHEVINESLEDYDSEPECYVFDGEQIVLIKGSTLNPDCIPDANHYYKFGI